MVISHQPINYTDWMNDWHSLNVVCVCVPACVCLYVWVGVLFQSLKINYLQNAISTKVCVCLRVCYWTSYLQRLNGQSNTLFSRRPICNIYSWSPNVRRSWVSWMHSKKKTRVNEFFELFYLKSEKRKFNAMQGPCQERGELWLASQDTRETLCALKCTLVCS